MDNGLIQFLVIAVFVIISMMDGAARKRRKEAQRLERMPEADRIPEAEDDLGEVAQSSEGMVPEDLWQEITALARGEIPAAHRESPEARDPSSTRDPSPEEAEWLDASAPTGTRSGHLQGGYEHPDQAATHKEHAEVASERPHEPVLHAPEPSTDPTEAAPHRTPPRRSRDSGSLLAGVRDGAKTSLRDAIVIAEVLDLPVALRGSDREPPP